MYDINVETCPHCGGKLRVIVCIEEPWLIQRILAHQRREALFGNHTRAPPDLFGLWDLS